MERGAVPVSDQLRVGGYDTALPSVISTIGAGGGTLRRSTRRGCYALARGALALFGPPRGLRSEPTVTDARLVLGRLQPGPYAGGAVADLDRARAIDERIASLLEFVSKTLRSHLALDEQTCCRRWRADTLERGVDHVLSR